MVKKPESWSLDVPEGCPIKSIAVDSDGGVFIVWDEAMIVNLRSQGRNLTMIDLILPGLHVDAREIPEDRRVSLGVLGVLKKGKTHED